MEDKKILIINSKFNATEPLLRLWEQLEKNGCLFYFLIDKKNTGSDSHKNTAYLGPALNSNHQIYLFFIFLPFLRIYNLLRLFFLKKKFGLKNIILVNWNEKLIFTSIADRLKIKIFWIELPENDYAKKSIILKRSYLKNSKKATLFTFLTQTAENLKRLGVKKDILGLSLFLNSGQAVHQDTIFSNIAKAEKPNYGRKYFTIGLISDFTGPNQLENLFRAVKNSLDVVHNIQLVLIGDGSEKKKFVWLAKKIGIESIAWFVGEQKHLKKWLDSFDLYLDINQKINLLKLENFLKAMQNGLPTISFKSIGYENFIGNEEGLLVEMNKTEDLTQKIIDLAQNSRRQTDLGKLNKARVEKMSEYDMIGGLLKLLI